MGYLGADIGFVILYHLARYRRKVVRDNMVKSFPEKTPKEIKAIEKRFYHNFCDLFAETLKLRRMKTETAPSITESSSIICSGSTP